MALDDAAVGSTLDYLGQSQPGLSQRLSTLPSGSAGGGAVAPPVTGGAGSSTGGPQNPMGVSLSAPGASPLALAIAALKGGGTLADLVSKLVPPTDLGTRGDTGGLSLSDAVRSLQAEGVDIPPAGGPLTGAEASLATEAEQGLAEGAGAGLGETIGSALPYVGAVIPLISSFASGGPQNSTQAANLAVDTAAAAAAPFTFGASAAASGIARGIEDLMAGKGFGLETILDFGGLGMLTSLFGHEGSYVPKRQEAGQTASADLRTLSADFQQAGQTFASSGDPSAALTALQTKFDARNPVRSYLHLDPALAQSVGITPDAAGNVQWGDLQPAQFSQLLSAFQTNPDLLTSAVLGSGDVAYLPQAQAQEVANAAAGEARALLSYLIQPQQAAAPAAAAPAVQGAALPTTPAAALPVTPAGPQGALGFAQDVVQG